MPLLQKYIALALLYPLLVGQKYAILLFFFKFGKYGTY